METPQEVSNESILAFAKAGVLFGHRKSKTHPKMRQYVSGVKNELALLDPEAIVNAVQRASDFLKEKTSKGGLLLVVGTTPPARAAIKALGERFQFPYVALRWLGGTLTNFKVISARLKHYQTLKEQRDRGELGAYTKKERLRFDQEIMKLAKMFDGLVTLTRLPDALVVVDSSAHMTAIREARRLGIPVVSVLDNDDDPDAVDFPVVANDHARSSVEWVLGIFAEAIEEGKRTYQTHASVDGGKGE